MGFIFKCLYEYISFLHFCAKCKITIQHEWRFYISSLSFLPLPALCGLHVTNSIILMQNKLLKPLKPLASIVSVVKKWHDRGHSAAAHL